MSVKEILSAALILFSVIDILGNIPVVISLKEQGKNIESGKATIAAGVLMILFLFVGEQILKLFGVDVSSFAVAGAIVIFIIGMEMIMGITLIHEEPDLQSSSLFPLAFPMIAGAGTLTTILSLRAEYETLSILLAIALNMVFIYLMIHFSDWIHKKIGRSGAVVIRKIFGIVLLAIGIKLFKTNWAL